MYFDLWMLLYIEYGLVYQPVEAFQSNANFLYANFASLYKILFGSGGLLTSLIFVGNVSFWYFAYVCVYEYACTCVCMCVGVLVLYKPINESWKGYTKHVLRAMAERWNGSWIRKLLCTTYWQSCLTWTIVEQWQNNTPIELNTP